eukprot:TRINITY_DN7559_c0_g1_i1.p1 TRINITY_DN7559_c0_g1~~TRINITY_DN7559_c0_g1_i1.p1  ORF type:complete len:362 (+),score=31.95 TRINITY_DN7559_c0_g1_i1:150-1235(+)
MGDEFFQRQPLLTTTGNAGDLDEDIEFTSRVRNGSAVKLEMPLDDRGGGNVTGQTHFPKEKWKTLAAILFVLIGFLSTTISLCITHELRPATADPLPDLVLDHIPYYRVALDISEVMIMVTTLSCAIIVLCHKYRWILVRRICLIVGLLYMYRAVTMIVTNLPSADARYQCDPQLNTTLTGIQVVQRVFKIMSGFGLSINGQHVYCGDFIFSGHTMILTLCYLIICEYTPKSFWLLQWFSFILGWGGVVALMLARGHYSVDVILAYFVTTRLWYIQHTVIAFSQLQQHSSNNTLTNHLSRMWWWRILVWFEKNVRQPLPNEFEIPRPWRIFYRSARAAATQAATAAQTAANRPRRDPARDI